MVLKWFQKEFSREFPNNKFIEAKEDLKNGGFTIRVEGDFDALTEK
jgi:hypothetical protein